MSDYFCARIVISDFVTQEYLSSNIDKIVEYFKGFLCFSDVTFIPGALEYLSGKTGVQSLALKSRSSLPPKKPETPHW